MAIPFLGSLFLTALLCSAIQVDPQRPPIFSNVGCWAFSTGNWVHHTLHVHHPWSSLHFREGFLEGISGNEDRLHVQKASACPKAVHAHTVNDQRSLTVCACFDHHHTQKELTIYLDVLLAMYVHDVHVCYCNVPLACGRKCSTGNVCSFLLSLAHPVQWVGKQIVLEIWMRIN